MTDRRSITKAATRLGTLSLGAALLMAPAPAQAVFFHIGSGSIDGSLCVGNDCVASPAFGFDTIRLSENNLRIHFEDTSTAAAFPPNDWRIRINDSANGGASYYAIEDATAGRTPFRVNAGARNNALFVDSQGDVGIGTSTPATDIDIKIGDTPTVRLQQDGTSGFTPQTWDVAGNEAGFFIRDATSGSTLPFRIMTGGAPSQSLVIDDTGNVGIGAGTNPDAALHVQRSTGAAVELLKLENNGGSFFTVHNSNTGDDWFFTHENNAPNRFIINSSVNPSEGLFLENDGDMTIGGVLTENSDKNAKMAIEPVDGQEILAKLATLPVSTWTYTDDTSRARHVGPMAQDFHALFGLGATETGISTLDTSGVALAAIQALVAQNEGLRARIEILEQRQAD